MAIYVSQATYDSGTPEQRAQWTIDSSIQTAPIQATPPQGTPEQQAPPQVQQTQDYSYSDKQRILLESGLAYGAPEASNYQQIYRTTPEPEKQYQYTYAKEQPYTPSPMQPQPYTPPEQFIAPPRNVQTQSSNGITEYYYVMGDNLTPLQGTMATQSVPTPESYNSFLNPTPVEEPKKLDIFVAGNIIAAPKGAIPQADSGTPWEIEQPNVENMRSEFNTQAATASKEGVAKYAAVGLSATAMPIFDETTGRGEVQYDITGIADKKKFMASTAAWETNMAVAEAEKQAEAEGYTNVHQTPEGLIVGTKTVIPPLQREPTQYADNSFQANIANSVMDVGASVERADYLGGIGEFFGRGIKSLDFNNIFAVKTATQLTPFAPFASLIPAGQKSQEDEVGVNYGTNRIGNVVESIFKTPSGAVKTGASGIGITMIGAYETRPDVGISAATQARSESVRNQTIQTFTNPSTYVEAGLAVAAFSVVGKSAKSTVPSTLEYATKKGYIKSEQIVKVDLEPTAPGSNIKSPVSSINQADIIAKVEGQDIIGVKPSSVYKFTPGTRYTVLGKSVDLFGDSSSQFTGAETPGDYALSGTTFKKGPSGYPTTQGANIEEIQFAGSEAPKQSIGKLEGTLQQGAYQNLRFSETQSAGGLISNTFQPIDFNAPKISGYTKSTPFEMNNQYQPFEMPKQATVRVTYPTKSVRLGIDVSPTYEGVGNPSPLSPFEPIDVAPSSKNALANRYVAEPSKPGQKLLEGKPKRQALSDVRVASESDGNIMTSEFKIETLAKGKGKIGNTAIDYEYFQFSPGETQMVFPGGRPGIIKIGPNVRGLSFSPEAQAGKGGGGSGEVSSAKPPGTKIPKGKPTQMINWESDIGKPSQIQVSTELGKAGATKDIMGGVFNQVSSGNGMAQMQMPGTAQVSAAASRSYGVSAGRQASQPAQQVFATREAAKAEYAPMEQVFKPASKTEYSVFEQEATKPAATRAYETAKPESVMEFVKPFEATKPGATKEAYATAKPYAINKPFEISKPYEVTKQYETTKPFEITKPQEITKQTEIQRQREITKQVEITKTPPFEFTPFKGIGGGVPYVPPLVPFGGLPWGGGGGSGSGYRERRGMSMKKSYAPDLFSSTFGFVVKGKAPAMTSGLGIRPIYIQEAPKRKASAKSLKYRTPKFRIPKYKGR